MNSQNPQQQPNPPSIEEQSSDQQNSNTPTEEMSLTQKDPIKEDLDNSDLIPNPNPLLERNYYLDNDVLTSQPLKY